MRALQRGRDPDLASAEGAGGGRTPGAPPRANAHRIFPDDGQDVADEEWIAHGLDRSWVPLSKDGRIKTRDLEIQPVLERKAVLFYLDNQQLRTTEMIERLVARRDAIHRAVENGLPTAYAVRSDRIERTWP
ncbi:toxin-antitoxin system, toxin component, PIN family protein [Streptomyces sp. NPDC048253]|uniref:PIN-like domain-containing protein n=1 Tax=Streptomyces sp. NPDC048253 TaxID=3365524 RepID=UPI003710680A